MTCRPKRVLAFAAPGWVFVSLLSAQSTRSFDAVSIRPNHSGADASDTTTTPGRLTLINATPISLLRRAFGVQDTQILGAPTWLATERFDIVAVTGDADRLAETDRQSRLQVLLAERFGLRYHREVRELRGYALVVAASAVKLVPSTSPGEYGMKVTAGPSGRILRSTKGNIPRLVEILSKETGRTVVNQTGLSAQYDFTLKWAPDETRDPGEPSLFTALQEQLGLRLKPASIPSQVIVIDHIERPSDN